MLVNFEKKYYKSEIMLLHKEYCDLQNIVHWHKEHELIYIKKGIAKIGVNKETYIASAGDLIICNSGDMHYINSIEKDTLCEILIFDSDYLHPLLPTLYLLPSYIKNEKVIEKNLDVQHFFDSISRELHGKNIFANEVLKAHIMYFFVMCLRKLDFNKDKTVQLTHKKTLLESYQNLLELIDKNYADIDFLKSARFMNFTPPHFSKIFKEISGMTFTDYLNYVKVEKAISLLQKTNLSVTAIADRCGFNNIRSFHRIFKKITGITPTNISPNYQISSNYHPRKYTNTTFDATVSQTILSGENTFVL